MKMSKNNMLSLSGKNGQMLLVAMLLIGVVIGIVAWQLTRSGSVLDGVLIIAAFTVLVLGIYFLVSAPFASTVDDYIPSQRSFRLVWGVILTTVGALLLVHIYIGMIWWVYVVVLIAVIAVLALIMFFKGSEG